MAQWPRRLNSFRAEEEKYREDIVRIIKDYLSTKGVEFVELDVSSQSEDFSGVDGYLYMKYNGRRQSRQISIRIRQNHYMHYQEVTIRSKSKGGGRTEINKVMDDHTGDIFVYLYENKQRNGIAGGGLFRTNIIRKLFWLDEAGYWAKEKSNGDGTAFIPFSFQDIKKQKGLLYEYKD